MRKVHSKSFGYYLAAFLMPILLYGAVMTVCRITPFGDHTLLLWDADGQYAAFLAALRRMLLEGESWVYSFSKVLGGSMTGVYAYYLASPLNWLVALFSEERLPLAFSVIVLVKLGLCGLSFYHYARHAYKAGLCGCLFAVSYALMGYMAIYFWDIMWLDAVILLPLLTLGLNRLAAGERPFLYLGALAIGLYCNYYIGLMLCLFSVLYFIYRITLATFERRLTRGECLRRAGRFAVASLLAGGLAAVLLLPAFLALQGGVRIWWDAVLALKRDASVLDVFTKLYTGAISFDQLRYGLPNIYIGIPVLALTGVYFLHPAVPRARRLMTLGLLGVFVLSFTLHPLYMVWHGLDDPNCMPARFSFLFSFLLLDAALQGYLALRREKTAFPEKRAFGLGAGFFAITCILFRAEFPDYLTYETVLADVLTFLCACGLIVMLGKAKPRRLVLFSLCLLQAGGLALNAYFCIDRCEVVNEMRASAYAETVESVSGLLDRVQAEDEGLYRMEKNFVRSENDPLLYGYNGLSHYSSDIKLQFNRFVNRLGLEHSYFRTVYANGTTPVLNSLFGVKYLLWKEGQSLSAVPEGYSPLWTEAGVTAYVNPRAMPFAYLVPSEETADPMTAENPFESQNALLTDLTGTPVTVFTPNRGVACANDGDWLTFTFPVKAGEKQYLHTTGAYFHWNDGGMEDRFRFSGCVALPVSEKEQTNSLKVMMPEGVDPAFYLYDFDSEAWDGAWQLLSRGRCEVTSNTASQLTVDVEAESDGQQLLLTLPYDDGWRAVVDGKPQALSRRYDTLLALDLTQGRHVVELRFTPRGLALGGILSGLCLLAVMAWRLLYRRKRDNAA